MVAIEKPQRRTSSAPSSGRPGARSCSQMLSDTRPGCVEAQSVCGVGRVCVGAPSIPLDEGAGRGKGQRWVVPSFGIPGKEVVNGAVILGVPQASPVSIFLCFSLLPCCYSSFVLYFALPVPSPLSCFLSCLVLV